MIEAVELIDAALGAECIRVSHDPVLLHSRSHLADSCRHSTLSAMHLHRERGIRASGALAGRLGLWRPLLRARIGESERA